MVTLMSLPRAHRLHRSTVRKSTWPPGMVSAMRVARASPPTPPPQPRPKIGRRSTWREKGRRLTSRASRLGIARPVIVLVTMAPMSSRSIPAAATALSVASSSSASALRWKRPSAPPSPGLS